MKLTIYNQPETFLREAQPFLEMQESANNLILGVALRLKQMPAWTDQPPYLAVGQDDAGKPIVTAVITPPHNLLLAELPDAPVAVAEQGMVALIENLKAGGWRVPGVNAENGLARRFARLWSQATGQRQHVGLEERIYELREVIPPPDPPAGRLRQATSRDASLLLDWSLAFNREITGGVDSLLAARSTTQRLEHGSIYLWEDREPVSMAVRTRPTPHGESVGSVYTPPGQRGQGYASACVAALSQMILDAGKEFCNLFTDLENPISNAIYQRIGYQPAIDFTLISFSD